MSKLSRIFLFSAIFCVPNAKADWTINFDTYFGAASVYPGVPAPWASVTFIDVVPGTVLMVVSNSLSLNPSIKLDALYLNFDPSQNVGQLSFNLYQWSGDFMAPTISVGMDSFMASEDGRFDIRLQFNSGGGAASTFNGGEYAVFEITGNNSLDATDFGYLSSHNNGGNSAFAAAHLLAVNGNGSSWIAPSEVLTVPEPAPTTLTGLGVGLLLLKCRWRGARRVEKLHKHPKCSGSTRPRLPGD